MWYPEAFYYQTFIGCSFRGSMQNSIVHKAAFRYFFYSLMSVSYELLAFLSIDDGLCLSSYAVVSVFNSAGFVVTRDAPSATPCKAHSTTLQIPLHATLFFVSVSWSSIFLSPLLSRVLLQRGAYFGGSPLPCALSEPYKLQTGGLSATLLSIRNPKTAEGAQFQTSHFGLSYL